MPNLQEFNKACPICFGQGVYQTSDNLEIDCPACMMEYKNRMLVRALHDVADYGIGHPNQPMVRAFHRETIKIAEQALYQYKVFGTLRIIRVKGRSSHELPSEKIP